RIPGPGNDALYSIDALAHGDVGTIISGTVDPDSYEEPHRAFVLLSTDGREFEVIELPTPVGAAADVDVNEVSWVGDRYVAVGTYSTDIFLQQSFDGRVWTEIGVPDLRRPRGEIVRWGTGWVGYFGGLVLLTGLAAS
ncbi:MAG TPA: hypothetical protein PK781_05025, partial [Terrimesophilobacter sp.]|nr:hypothetical protein [Terrimesophilobacter sp.]